MSRKPNAVPGGGKMPLDRKPKSRRGPAQSSGQDIMKGEGLKTGCLGYSKHVADPGYYRKQMLGIPPTDEGVASGTSIFDPVLAELCCRWFCPPGGSVLDPFAGDSTKGIVASYCGFDYTGIELREEQVLENYRQAGVIAGAERAEWIVGDSARTNELLGDRSFDLVFTSPPYYDLEVYSDDENDGSAMQSYEDFMEFYRIVFKASVEHLKEDRFLVVKVGEIRDRQGAYRNFVGDNISLFMDLGLHYYNEAILVTAVGSLPIRVGKQFASGRKLGKTHQNILVFFKGNMKRIKEDFPATIEFAEIQQESD